MTWQRRRGCHRPDATGPWTVSRALDVYFERLQAEGSKSVGDARQRAALHIRPEFGEVLISDLTREQVAKGHSDMANRPRSVREPSVDNHGADANESCDVRDRARKAFCALFDPLRQNGVELFPLVKDLLDVMFAGRRRWPALSCR